MGVSVEAYLAYGVNIQDLEAREKLPWSPYGPDEEIIDEYSEQRPCFATWLLQLEGIEDPSAGVVSFEAWYEEAPSHQEQMREYWERRNEIEDTAPIVNLQGWHDDSFIVLAVRGTVSRANWGQPIEPTITVEDENVQAARAFCELHDITFENPKWLLISDSDYGR